MSAKTKARITTYCENPEKVKLVARVDTSKGFVNVVKDVRRDNWSEGLVAEIEEWVALVKRAEAV